MTDETIQVRNTESGAMMDVLVLRKRAECIEVVIGKGKIRITASMGVAVLTKGEGPDRWIARADTALYQAKEGGRDRVVIDPVGH